MGKHAKRRRTSSKLFILIAMLFFTLVVAAIFFVLSEMLDTADRKLSEYRDVENGYVFKYPREWQLIGKEELKNIDPGFDAGLVSEGKVASIGIRVEKKRGSVSLWALEEELDKNMLQKLSGFRKLRSEQVEVSEYPALEYEYIYNFFANARAKQRLIIVITPEKVYYITYHAYVGDFPNYEKDFKIMTKNFRVID